MESKLQPLALIRLNYPYPLFQKPLPNLHRIKILTFWVSSAYLDIFLWPQQYKCLYTNTYMHTYVIYKMYTYINVCIREKRYYVIVFIYGDITIFVKMFKKVGFWYLCGNNRVNSPLSFIFG